MLTHPGTGVCLRLSSDVPWLCLRSVLYILVGKAKGWWLDFFFSFSQESSTMAFENLRNEDWYIYVRSLRVMMMGTEST